MGRDGTVMGVLREWEGSRDGAGGSLCLSPPRSPEPAAPQHPSPGRVQVVAGELSSASPVAPSRRPGCCPPGRIPRQGARQGRRGNLGRGGPLLALPGSPRPPPAVGADFGVPSHPPGQPGPPRRLAQEKGQDDLGDFFTIIGTDFTVICPDQMTPGTGSQCHIPPVRLLIAANSC